MRSECQGDMPLLTALEVLDLWIQDGLQNVRFSGGEPLLYPHLLELVSHCTEHGVKRVAVSTNGSFPTTRYMRLIDAGVSDFSISLDACCAGDAQAMAGGYDAFEQVTENIRQLSRRTYVSIGIVLTEHNQNDAQDTIMLARELGASDIRVIPAAQDGSRLLVNDTLQSGNWRRHPILNYRLNNAKNEQPIRGLRINDTDRCRLVLDDSCVAGDAHYPCVIYFREGGRPIGKIGPDMRRERIQWSHSHNTHADCICRQNCLDVCVAYNNRHREIHDMSQV